MATLTEVFGNLFPDATTLATPFDTAPLLPADVFAFCGHLLERSGAYHHIEPEVGPSGSAGFRRLIVSQAMREGAVETGRQWREAPLAEGSRLPDTPARVTALWRSLAPHAGEDAFIALPDTGATPGWWAICLELLMIADEACWSIGFDDSNPFSSFTLAGYVDADLSSGHVFRRIQRAPFTISSAAEDILCVQAKSRTPSLGCTLRSLSHHLALLPPRGQVRARWVQPVFEAKVARQDAGLGLLLVPFPFRVPADAFRPAGVDPDDHWGWFEADQSWLPSPQDNDRRNAFAAFVVSLVQAARDAGKRVDAVVLPELALDYALFRTLGSALARDAQIDFLISGVSSDQHQRSGNFVAIAPFFLAGAERTGDIRGWEQLVLVREKHHRWKLEEAQIAAYGLDLDPSKSWWERLNILSRSFDVMVYRGGALTTLICEDLARVDPCQAVVRAIGPNLLIALLMDGPQIGARWPGRYATVLAEDPGTSVLSFTSFGLIARQNSLGAFAQASAIALWKDQATGAQTLELPRDADALVLGLKAVQKTERTLDGRTDDGASHRWEYDFHIPVASDDKPDWITTGGGRA